MRQPFRNHFQEENARPRGSGASSATTVEDCSIHGQDNPAKGTRAREKNACVDPPRMVEEGKYVRTYVRGRTNLFSEKQAHIHPREDKRDGRRRVFFHCWIDQGENREAIIETPSCDLPISVCLLLSSLLMRPQDHLIARDAAIDLDESAAFHFVKFFPRLVINLDVSPIVPGCSPG